MKIDPRAIVGEGAKLGEGVEVGAFAIVEDGVELGSGVKVWPRAHICAGTSIGERAEIHMGAVVGHLPQDLSFDRTKATFTRIGKGTVLREYSTINRATKDGGATVIGDACYFMAGAHVGHDCIVGDNVIIANNTLLGGHVTVGNGTFISGNVAIHQFSRIGRLAMVGGFSGINMDVPPFMIARGPSVMRGVNLVGLRRAKIERATIASIKEMFVLLFKSDLNTTQALERIAALPQTTERDQVIEFIKGSRRGICKYKYSDTDYFD